MIPIRNEGRFSLMQVSMSIQDIHDCLKDNFVFVKLEAEVKQKHAIL